MNPRSPFLYGLRQFNTGVLTLTFTLLPLAQAMARPTQAEVDKQAAGNVTFDRTVIPITPYQKMGKIDATIEGSRAT
ncbi:hypothetical protein [Acinetobacter zhairhuonensis]|uniref:hypothetical protein n=1 Tax=Acinetobacter sp. A7.4 TaxID=2919921 RepID=UPI001F4F5D27|nr:hypothetical protein [Acinetobacter sp. A7.4]MCJ8162006.1 hypothetical protein [Acinetobacter sp. A7.4]